MQESIPLLSSFFSSPLQFFNLNNKQAIKLKTWPDFVMKNRIWHMPHILLKYDKIGSTTSWRISFFKYSIWGQNILQGLSWVIPCKTSKLPCIFNGTICFGGFHQTCPKDLQTYKSKYLKRLHHWSKTPAPWHSLQVVKLLILVRTHDKRYL